MSGAGMADLLVGATVGTVQQAAQVGECGRGRSNVLDGVNPLCRVAYSLLLTYNRDRCPPVVQRAENHPHPNCH